MSRPAPAPTSSACYCETPKTAGFGCGFLPLDSFFLSLLPMIRTPYEFATETISDVGSQNSLLATRPRINCLGIYFENGLLPKSQIP